MWRKGFARISQRSPGGVAKVDALFSDSIENIFDVNFAIEAKLRTAQFDASSFVHSGECMLSFFRFPKITHLPNLFQLYKNKHKAISVHIVHLFVFLGTWSGPPPPPPPQPLPLVTMQGFLVISDCYTEVS